jgi:hypothetical protein
MHKTTNSCPNSNQMISQHSNWNTKTTLSINHHSKNIYNKGDHDFYVSGSQLQSIPLFNHIKRLKIIPNFYFLKLISHQLKLQYAEENTSIL